MTPLTELAGVARTVGLVAADPDGFASLDAAASAHDPRRSRPHSAVGLERVLRQAADGRWRWDLRFVARGWGGDADEPEARTAGMAGQPCAAANRVAARTLLVRGARSDLVGDESAPEFLPRARPRAARGG